jgi:outer membrane beta-barrel protein
MKRPAICLFVSVAIVGWAAIGHAKKGGGSKPAPADNAEDTGGDQKPAAGGADETKAGATDTGDKGGAPASESLDTTGDEGPAGKVEEEIGGPKAARPSAQLSWKDIVVVPRKPFLKGGRLELSPFAGLSINDNLIRHYMFGVDLNYFLTDVLWIGLQGQYFIKQLTDQEELVGLQYNRTPTLNQYLYGGALNFGYVPVYGKFALFNRAIMHWEIWASAGVGVTFTEVIPRDPANASLAFKNTDLTPNAGIGSRFFLFDWLTVNFALRDYIVPDKFEHNPDPPIVGGVPTPYANAAAAKAGADTALVNNIMFYAGVGIYLPTKFTYKTPQ